jgi:hypothetical protein
MTNGPMMFGQNNHSDNDTTHLSSTDADETIHFTNLGQQGGGIAVFGHGRQAGVKGWSDSHSSRGVEGESRGVRGVGVHGIASGPPGQNEEIPFGNRSIGVWGKAGADNCLAAWFTGRVVVWGDFITAGAKSFRIDHPLDPENRYLQHACVESPEPLNLYGGTVVTDQEGKAVVELPDYFEALNTDVRYQLTVIGGFAQAVVAEEVQANRFTIATDKPEVKVSWQVSGVRQDAYIKAHPWVVEQDKHESERGTYVHPEAWGKPRESGWAYERETAYSSISDIAGES